MVLFNIGVVVDCPVFIFSGGVYMTHGTQHTEQRRGERESWRESWRSSKVFVCVRQVLFYKIIFACWMLDVGVQLCT